MIQTRGMPGGVSVWTMYVQGTRDKPSSHVTQSRAHIIKVSLKWIKCYAA